MRVLLWSIGVAAIWLAAGVAAGIWLARFIERGKGPK